MKKQYMDFVPVNKAKTVEKIMPTTVVRKTITTRTVRRAPVTQKIAGRPVTASKTVANFSAENQVAAQKRTTMKIPQANFINQEKIVKRPLSRNIYMKELEKQQPEKKPDEAPMMIVSTPEKKGSKTGVVIAIILTVILGAVAGTIAFFFLPR